MDMKDVRKMAVSSGLFDTSEIRRAIAFLHDLGSLQHFTTHFLKSRVVIDPQWIVDVMARVVNVKESVIKDGKLRHCDVRKVWKEFPKHLDEWLLRLTEEYDLTFPLADKSLNLVPCLLPENPPPNFKWPDVRKGERETKMIYKFHYLPLGLFNRVQVTSSPIMHQSVMYLIKCSCTQVRLYFYSDSSFIWRRGSLLRKNKHVALMTQTRASEVLVRAQGARPENMLFLVHEVFDTLIKESFHGVKFDFQVPCPECSKEVRRILVIASKTFENFV